MLALFKQTFQLNLAILTNSIIYRLRRLPLIKHLVPGELYGNEGINAVAIVLLVIITIISTFFSQTLYLFILVGGAQVMQPDYMQETVLILFFFVTLFSAFHYNQTFRASKEKYYAVVLMRIDANAYALMDLVTTLIKKSIVSVIALIILSLLFQFPIYFALLYPAFYIGMNLVSTYLLLKVYQNKKVLYSDKFVFSITSMVLMVLCILGMISALHQNWFQVSQLIYISIAILCIPLSIVIYNKLKATRTFTSIYKKKLTLESVMLNTNVATDSVRKSVTKGLNQDVAIDHSKKGFDFFNDVFFRRHKKLLFNSALNFTLIFALILVVTCIAIYMFPQSHQTVRHAIEMNMPFILLVMYFTNRGAKVTLAMFVNCDASMLHYRFYRQPKVILSLFTQRLKTVIIVNMMPSLVISIGVVAMLFLSSNTFSFTNAALIFISINLLSVFFSVHHLILYYLLQPYDISLQARGYLFNIINTITYLVCFYAKDFPIPLFGFTIGVIIFCILYVVIAIVLVYRFAPKTFKIKN